MNCAEDHMFYNSRSYSKWVYFQIPNPHIRAFLYWSPPPPPAGCGGHGHWGSQREGGCSWYVKWVLTAASLPQGCGCYDLLSLEKGAVIAHHTQVLMYTHNHNLYHLLHIHLYTHYTIFLI